MRFCIILHSVFPLLNLNNLSLSVLIVVQTAFSYILAMQWLSVYLVASIRSNHYTNLRNRKGFRIFIELLFLAKLIFWRNYTLCNVYCKWYLETHLETFAPEERKPLLENYILWTGILLPYVTVSIFPFFHNVLVANCCGCSDALHSQERSNDALYWYRTVS